MVPWFVEHWVSWFIRGNVYFAGTDSGEFAFGVAYGNSYGNGSFRAFVNYKTY